MKKLSNFLFVVCSLAIALVAGMVLYNYGANHFSLTHDQAAVTAAVGGALLFASSFSPLPAGSMAFALTGKRVKRNANPKNIGGMEDKFYYALEEDIDTWPDAITPDFEAATTYGQLVTIPADDPFVMKTGKFFHEVPCSPEEGQIKTTLVGPTDSPGFQNEFSVSNAGNNDELRGWIAANATKNLIIIGKELNGTMKVVGRPGSCARIKTTEGSNGAKVADGNLLKTSFMSMAEVPCPTYLAPVPLDATEV